MRRLLVTGGTGYIGRVVVAQLLAQGYEVHSVARGPSPFISPLLTHHQADLLDTGATEALIEALRPSHLLHLAWDLSGDFYRSDANEAWMEAGLHLAEAFANHGGQRLAVAGTCVEYDLSFGYCEEGQTPLQPVTRYGRCKHQLHQRLQSLAQQQGLNLAWLRLFSSFGPGEAPGRLIPSAVRALYEQQPMACSDGEQVRDYLHVYDVASACIAVLRSSFSGAVNIASGRPVRVADLLQRLAQLADKTEPFRWGARERRPSDPAVILGSTRKLHHATNWRPFLSLEAGLWHVLRRTAWEADE